MRHCLSVSLILAAALAGCGPRAIRHVSVDKVPLGKVVVYRNGVAFYERRAQIDGGKLTVRVDESPKVVQPGPLSRGETRTQQDSTLSAEEAGDSVVHFKPGASLARLVDALNLLGTSPSDLVAILEALKQAGALKAEMVVI